jgi:hypothetical protein
MRKSLGDNQNRSEMKKKTIFLFFVIFFSINCSVITIMDKSTKQKVASPTKITFPSDYPSITKSITQTSSPTHHPTQTAICPPKPYSNEVISSIQKETEELIPESKVIWFDDFICSDYSYGWWTPNNFAMISIHDSILTIKFKRSPDIMGALIRNAQDIYDNKGVLVLFRYEYGTSVNFLMDSGIWDEESYRGWGLSINGDGYGHNYWDRWTTKYLTTTDIATNILKPKIWIYFFIRLYNNGAVTMNYWQKESPSRVEKFYLNLGDDWSGRNWKMQFQMVGGTLEVDKYWQLLFTK